eukprot:Nitzschia sp. Nitz4//scaffold161_size51353//18458//19192//NITZ4_006946-RA/size51353-processed-gene-0.71-mRNA-1//-1//CDS//3329537903//7716//frame0
MHLRPAILLFGDSITQRSFGVGNIKYGWASLLSAIYQRRADILNRGFSGYNTTHALELLPRVFGSERVTDPNYLFITVFFGANDAALPGERQHVPKEQYTQNLRDIVKKIRELTKSSNDKSPPIILITPPPVENETLRKFFNRDTYDRTNDVAREYGLETKKVAQEMGCSVLDTWELFGGGKPGYEKHLCDGLHLSESGNELVFQGLVQLLQESYPELLPDDVVDSKEDVTGISMEEKPWDQLC